jgi:hypothetical protein
VKKTPEGTRELRVSDGRALPLDNPLISPPTLAWSPSGCWLALLRDRQVIVLNAESLQEIWRSQPRRVQSGYWDRNCERLLLWNAEREFGEWFSFEVWRSPRDCLPLLEPEGFEWSDPLGPLWITDGWIDADAADTIGTRGAVELIRVLPTDRMTATPVAEFLADRANEFRWSKDGRALAWDEPGKLSVWHRDTETVRRLLRWRGEWSYPFELVFSPDGEYLMGVFFVEDHPPRVAIARASGGEAISFEPVAATEWNPAWNFNSYADWEDDLHLAFGLEPAEGGGSAYRCVRRLQLSDLPMPWRLEPEFWLPTEACEPIRHLGRDYSCLFTPLPDGLPDQALEVRLEEMETGAVLAGSQLQPREIGSGNPAGLVVVRSERVGVYDLIGVDAESAALTRWLSFEYPGRLPLHLRLQVTSLQADAGTRPPQPILVPVLTAPASFDCAHPEVACLAFWVENERSAANDGA